MAGKMQTLLENLDHFLEVLALSQTVHVKDWDVSNVKRGLEWGSYFQQVHHRFKGNSCVKRAFEDRLRFKNEQLHVSIKNYYHVAFNDLEKSRDILCKSLLQNIALPDTVFKYLFEMIQDPMSKGTGFFTLDRVIARKAACELFLSLPLLVSKDTGDPLDNPILVTQADMLKSTLATKLMVLEDNQKLSTVSAVLSGISRPAVYHLVALTLLSDGSLNADPESSLAELVLDWLLSDNTALTGFCSAVSCQVLTRLSCKYSRFWNVYLDYLVELGSGMEQDLTSGKWVSGAPEPSLEMLLEHFQCLVKGYEHLKESTLSRLQTLKSQDGNYDVCGISIWTDLLIEINTFLKA